jgi:hydroxypyruvate reductase
VTAGIDPEALLREVFAAAVAAADPALCLPRFLPSVPNGRTLVIGAGKASAAMALAFESHWQGDLEGLVVTAHGHSARCRRVEIVEATHPVPGAEGERAAERMLGLVSRLGRDDLVVCLLSGGGSALLPLPQDGLALDAKRTLTRDLLRCGATIAEINCVRRHLSRLKGGRLAAACHPARVVTLAISDVPGDDPVDIASGPTVADPTTCADALRLLGTYGIEVPSVVTRHLQSGAWESVKPGDPRLATTEYRIIAAARQSLEAAARCARAARVEPLIVSDRLQGEARVVAAEMARLVAEVATAETPRLLLSGGETTVTVGGDGRGGRNVEFLLAFGVALGERANVFALAADTDGIDGTEPIAGAIWHPDTLGRAASRGLDPRGFLERNDAHTFFDALGDSVVTGPTRTNVNDFRAVLVLPAGAGGGR